RTIIGVSRVALFARKNFNSCSPSIWGMTRSCKMTVGCTVLAVSIALVGSWQKWNSMSGSPAATWRTAWPTMAWSSISKTVTGRSAEVPSLIGPASLFAVLVIGNIAHGHLKGRFVRVHQGPTGERRARRWATLPGDPRARGAGRRRPPWLGEVADRPL